jgi:hypothetical protein
MCQIPRGFPGWWGTSVRWKGILIGTFEHGFALVSTECSRRGIAIMFGNRRLSDQFYSALYHPGISSELIEADFTGKITRRGLLINEIHSLRTRRISDEEENALFKALGF